MEEIQISKFQKNTFSIIDAIVNTQQPVLVRNKERVLVKIVPFPYSEKGSWLGCMRDKGKITGDIISPAEDEDNWKVLSE